MLGPAPGSPAEHLFRQAVRFTYSSQVLFTHTELRLEIWAGRAKNPWDYCPCAVPSVVLSAFSLEMYLKCLSLLTVGDFPKAHGLKSLFNNLPSQTQADIQSEYDRTFADFRAKHPDSFPSHEPDGTPVPTNEYDLDVVLNRTDNSFVQWRYVYEAAGNADFYGQDPLTESLAAVILRLQPGWQQWRDEFVRSHPTLQERRPHA